MKNLIRLKRTLNMSPLKSCSIFLIILVIFLPNLTNCSDHIEPIVTIKQGKLRGKVSESRQGRRFVSFLGIPFGTVANPFSIGGPEPSWSKVRDATKFGEKCMQFDRVTSNVTGAIDCLFLNVYTPVYSSPKQTRVPIIMVIHGGEFLTGSGNDYDPSYLMDEDVICVTFNYRIGAFGFLTTQDKLLPPNLGLKDQVAAMNWVKHNIRNFGGDELRVTLLGQSSGGAAVSLHLISPMSKGLFHRAISMSGTALCPWVLRRKPEKTAIALAESLNTNCSIANSYTISACLKNTNPQHIIEKQQELTGWSRDALSAIPFAPVVESMHNVIDSGPIFLPDSPTKLFREGKFHKNIPWITGVNSADGVTSSTAHILNSTQMLRHVDMNWREIAPLLFNYKESAPNVRQVSQRVRDFYFGPMSKITMDKKENFTDALSDRNFFRCAKSASLLYATKSPVYIYYFTYRSNFSILDSYDIADNLGLNKVVHGDELQFLFKMPWFPEIHTDSPYYSFSKALVRLWSSFATDGYPKKLLRGAREWPSQPSNPIKPESFIRMYKIDDYTELIDEPFYYRLAFWDKLRLLPHPPQSTTQTQPSDGDDDEDDKNSSDFSRSRSSSSPSGMRSGHQFLTQISFLVLTLFVALPTQILF